MSLDLKETIVKAKHANLIDRSLDLNWSDARPKTASERLYNVFFTEPASDFDLKVDAHVQKKQIRETKKRLRATTIDHDQIYAEEYPMFLGEVRVGANQDLIDVVFDTGSDWLAVPDTSCDDCFGTTVDNSGST